MKKYLSLILMLFCAQVFGASPLVSPKARFLDANGNPLAGGKVYTYAAGTTTPQATYTDAAEGTPNANPVVLDANGETNIWLTDDSYKIVLKNSADVTQWTVDNFSLNLETGQIANGAVTATKLASDSVTSAKILDGTIAAADIGSDAVTTAKILDSNVTTGKLATGAVTQAKRASLGQQLSSSSGTYSTTSTSAVDVTNLSVSITTTGRPVFLAIVQDGSAFPGYLRSVTSGSTNTTSTIYFTRDSTDIATLPMQSSVTGGTTVGIQIPGSFFTVDIPAAGTYTYKIKAKSASGATTELQQVKLLAFEL